MNAPQQGSDGLLLMVARDVGVQVEPRAFDAILVRTVRRQEVRLEPTTVLGQPRERHAALVDDVVVEDDVDRARILVGLEQRATGSRTADSPCRRLRSRPAVAFAARRHRRGSASRPVPASAPAVGRPAASSPGRSSGSDGCRPRRRRARPRHRWPEQRVSGARRSAAAGAAFSTGRRRSVEAGPRAHRCASPDATRA